MPTKRVPEGRKITFVKGRILEELEFPFSHGKLPYIRLTAIDLPNKLHPISKYEIKEYWLDIGQVDDYEKAQTIYKDHFKRDK